MKFLLFTCSLALMLLTSCSVFLPPSRNPNTLSLKLEIPMKEVYSIEEVQLKIYLSNQSDSSILVHKRLSSVPFPAPPKGSEMVVLISDSSGNLIDNQLIIIDYTRPSEDTLNILKPGEQIKKSFRLGGVGFDAFFFQIGETYTVEVVYQNTIDVVKNIDGIEIPSWVGIIHSNKETFIILP